MLITAALFISHLNIRAQEIKIGEACPDIVLKDILNFETDEISMRDLRGKFIILDFWATSCGACIHAFPKMDSLQKKYQGRLQIIAVNPESMDKTIKFFNRMRHIKKTAIPFATGDTILSTLFPHLYVPHHVWIDSAGIVRYITDGYNATEDHIDQFLENKDLLLAEKKYEANAYFENPMAAIANKKGIEHLESYSLLMHCISGITFSNAAVNTNGNDMPNRITQNCASVSQLYEAAFSENGKHDFNAENTIIYNIRDKARFVIPKDGNLMDDWKANYSFNYELMVPESDAAMIYKKMQLDLARYFNVKGVVEKRIVRCLALVGTNTHLLRTKGGQAATNFWVVSTDTARFMINQPFTALVAALSISHRAKTNVMPFVDLTGYKGNIDIQLNSNALATFDLKKLKIELNRYGLDLITTDRLSEVLVLNEF